MSFQAAVKSFVGHLEGSGKAGHTVASYRFDLRHFEEFMKSRSHQAKELRVQQISRKDLERYHEQMKLEGQKTNTRRRKLMTLRKLMNYLMQRKKLEVDVAKKLPAPEKIERIPFTVPTAKLIEAIRGLDQNEAIFVRNRAILWFLAETGCAVSELVKLRWTEVDLAAKKVEILGKNERQLKISSDLASALEALRAGQDPKSYCFTGHNRYGRISGAITTRGVELLVKGYQEKLGLGELTPRLFRHSAVIHWYEQGVSANEIQKRLGLKTPYAFRVYAPLFSKIRSTNEATSTE